MIINTQDTRVAPRSNFRLRERINKNKRIITSEPSKKDKTMYRLRVKVFERERMIEEKQKALDKEYKILINHLDELPSELLIKILSHLDISRLLAFRLRYPNESCFLMHRRMKKLDCEGSLPYALQLPKTVNYFFVMRIKFKLSNVIRINFYETSKTMVYHIAIGINSIEIKSKRKNSLYHYADNFFEENNEYDIWIEQGNLESKISIQVENITKSKNKIYDFKSPYAGFIEFLGINGEAQVKEIYLYEKSNKRNAFCAAI